MLLGVPHRMTRTGPSVLPWLPFVASLMMFYLIIEWEKMKQQFSIRPNYIMRSASLQVFTSFY